MLRGADSDNGEISPEISTTTFFLATSAGIVQVLGITVLQYTKHLEKTGEASFSKASKKFFVVLNIVTDLVATALFTMANAEGPVALSMPFRNAAQLLSNMGLQMALGITDYTKSMRVGTCVVFFAVMCLGDNGPAPQPGRDTLELLSTYEGIGCMLGLLLIVCLGMVGVYALQSKPSESTSKISAYAAVIAGSSALVASGGKVMLTLDGHRLYLWASIVLWVSLGVLNTAALTAAAKYTDAAVLLPVSRCLNLLLNCVAGLCVWQDWRVIDGWTSYIAVYSLIIIGTYELSSLDALSAYRSWKKRLDENTAKASEPDTDDTVETC